MRKQFFSFALLLLSLTAWAQHGMQVWHNGKYVLFPITNVDSVKFIRCVTDIYLSQSVMELNEGETKQLTVSVYPIDADDKTVTWSSSVSNVASVDENGLVMAVRAGTTVITAIATDGSGVKAECHVNVIGGGVPSFLTCPNSNHPHAIDLGLPSGTKWCCCNVGASTPEGYGGYYAWGETQPKEYYDWSTYKYCKGSFLQLTKFCTNSLYGNNGFTDGLTELLPENDAVTANWGSPWHLPTFEQITELLNNCSREWTIQNETNGILVIGPSGGQLFLPAAGYRWFDDLIGAGCIVYYWSSSLYQNFSYGAYGLYFSSGYWDWGSSNRDRGRSVRAVCQ